MQPSRFKSRTFRRIKVRTPGGKMVVHYKKRKPKAARCTICKAVLKGVPRERPIKMRKMAKSKKVPSRPYAGNLCSKCMRSVIKRKGRNIELKLF